MQYEEIPVRSKIVISVTNGSDMQARFVTKVMRNMGAYLLVVPFRHKGLRVNFNGKNVKIHMEMRDNEGILWSFRNCKVSVVRKDGLIYHKLFCGMRNGIENRRGGRRFYIWESAAIHVDGIANPIFTNIRDIGPIGFSFVVDYKKKLEIKEGTKIETTVKGRDGDELHVEGMVVRKEALEKYMVYGCKLENPSDQLLAHIKYLEKKNVIVDAEV